MTTFKSFVLVLALVCGPAFGQDYLREYYNYTIEEARILSVHTTFPHSLSDRLHWEYHCSSDRISKGHRRAFKRCGYVPFYPSTQHSGPLYRVEYEYDGEVYTALLRYFPSEERLDIRVTEDGLVLGPTRY